MRGPSLNGTPEDEHLMTAPSETDQPDTIEPHGIKKLKGAEIQFECSCGEKVSIPFTFQQPLTKAFTIPCLCQMHYTVEIHREQGSITVQVLGKKDQLETIF